MVQLLKKETYTLNLLKIWIATSIMSSLQMEHSRKFVMSPESGSPNLPITRAFIKAMKPDSSFFKSSSLFFMVSVTSLVSSLKLNVSKLLLKLVTKLQRFTYIMGTRISLHSFRIISRFLGNNSIIGRSIWACHYKTFVSLAQLSMEICET